MEQKIPFSLDLSYILSSWNLKYIFKYTWDDENWNDKLELNLAQNNHNFQMKN